MRLSLVIFALFCAVCLAGIDDGLLAYWPCEEGSGIWTADTVGGKDIVMNNGSWAKGAFGTALRFTGNSSCGSFILPVELNGANEMSLSIWALWDGFNKWPNLFHAGWMPGGWMLYVSDRKCTFRIGIQKDPTKGVSKDNWLENWVGCIDNIEPGKWYHIAVVFKRPVITVYVNGKKVRSVSNWNHELRVASAMGYVGSWDKGPNTHNGLIDEIRLYGRALHENEIQKLADIQGREDGKYNSISMKDMPLLTRLETRTAIMKISQNGLITSLMLKSNGRELLGEPLPLCTAYRDGKPMLVSRRLMLEPNNVLDIDMMERGTILKMKVESTGDYFKFTPQQVSIPGLTRLRFCQLQTKLNKYYGRMSGLASDDEDGLLMRSLSLKVKMLGFPRADGRILFAEGESYCGFDGIAAAVAAAPKKEILDIARTMQEKENVPKSKNGGPWTLESELTRGSYLFANLAHKDTDRWIDIAKRGGFQFIHFHAWWKTLGHYDVNPRYFPNGISDMKDSVDRIHLAGLKATFHTLTACINPNDSWVTPVPSDDLISLATYTLAKPMSPSDDVIYVNEEPIKEHEIVWSYSCNGNAIKIGKEIIQYTEISREKPYAFKKCVRGAFRTKKAAHAAGDKAEYLQQRYIAFYPKPDSKLADDLADAIANVYNTCGMDGLYFDGSEGMRSRYGIDTMRWKIFSKLNGTPVTEASEWGHNSWWIHSRLGAWDYPHWAFRQNHDAHVRQKVFRESDFEEIQMGWWAPIGPSEKMRGQFPDEFEYFAAKNLGIDGPMSIENVRARGKQQNGRMDELLTILGWYERVRLARYFEPDDLKPLAEPGKDFTLRMNNQGKWLLTPMDITKRRMTSLGDATEQWTADCKYAGPLNMRLEALYAADVKSKDAFTLVDFTDNSIFSKQDAAAKVTQDLKFLPPENGADFRRMAITAKNDNDFSNRAWTRLQIDYPFPHKNFGTCRCFGIWVKGDASGAVLNIQFKTPYIYYEAVSDHYIDIDFSGWKFFTLLFRERDAERMQEVRWPYNTISSILANTRTALDFKYIERVSIFLNNIPAKGNTNIEIGEIKLYPQEKAIISNPCVTVNGRKVKLPVDLLSGEYLEVDAEGNGMLFSEDGTIMRRFKPVFDNKLPQLNAGANQIELEAKSTNEFSPRAEVTLFTHGTSFGTVNKDVNWKYMMLDYEMPRTIFQEDGHDNVWNINVLDYRKKAPPPKIEFDLDVVSSGPLSPTQQSSENSQLFNPTLNINGKSVSFKCSLKSGQRLRCRNEMTFAVLDDDDKTVQVGRVTGTFPKLKPGTNKATLTFGKRDSDNFKVIAKITKVYK